MKLRRAFSLGLGLMVQIAQNISKVGVQMLFYEMSMQIYDQTSIQRNWSKVKFHRTVLPRLALRGLKIAWNTTKVVVHAFL